VKIKEDPSYRFTNISIQPRRLTPVPDVGNLSICIDFFLHKIRHKIRHFGYKIRHFGYTSRRTSFISADIENDLHCESEVALGSL